MEIHQLKYFIALTQELNFQRAARRAHISQPSLSHAISKLEKQLGHALFERSPRQVRLTAAGEKLLPHALAILDCLRQSIEAMGEDTGEISGRLRISAIPTIGPYLLPVIIREFRKRAPKVVLEIHEQTTSLLTEDLRAGKLDAGIISLPVKLTGLASRVLASEEFYLAVSPRHPLAKKKRVSREDILTENLLILQEGHCFAAQALAFCKRSRRHERVIFEGGSLNSVLKLVAAGEGITFAPRMAAEKSPNLRYIRFESPEPTRDLGVVWRLTAPVSRAQALFTDITEKALNLH